MTPTISGARFRLHHLEVLRPRHEDTQKYALGWLANAHAFAETRRAGLSDTEHDAFRKQLETVLLRLGGWPDRISRRGSEITDLTHADWPKMAIYDLEASPLGAGMEARTRYFAERAMEAFRKLFADTASPPDDLIHVTCTGYSSPSAAQRIVEEKGWQSATTVTHAYHMGCYASVPALRLARGFLAAAFTPLESGHKPAGARRVDIVHTELCTLHLNPLRHDLEQLVVQSLFADGFIKYSVSVDVDEQYHSGEKTDCAQDGFEILALQEHIVPGTLEGMSWECADWGMRMGLSAKVPALIQGAIREFVSALFRRAALDFGEWFPRCLFAVHPGGPKIIDKVQETLELADDQVSASKKILFHYGNMSSATLPHIWQAIVNDPDVLPGTPVVSLAFGPGLTVCGALLRKL